MMITQQQGIGGTGFVCSNHSLPQAIVTDNDSNNNNIISGGAGGMKRLASCREELERSWQLNSNSSNGISISNDNTNNMMMMDTSNNNNSNNNKNNNFNNPLRHCISNDNDGMTSASDDEDHTDYGTRVVKRRRTIHATNFTNGLSNDITMMEDHCGMVPGTTRAIRISPATRPRQTEVPIKAGWYEGEVNGHGARHGRGITRNDDGTEYEGPYCNDIMEGSNGR